MCSEAVQHWSNSRIKARSGYINAKMLQLFFVSRHRAGFSAANCAELNWFFSCPIKRSAMSHSKHSAAPAEARVCCLTCFVAPVEARVPLPAVTAERRVLWLAPIVGCRWVLTPHLHQGDAYTSVTPTSVNPRQHRSPGGALAKLWPKGSSKAMQKGPAGSVNERGISWVWPLTTSPGHSGG